ncbi:MAG: LPS-assembly protein LptD [Lewinellaceae bacterium]|nr:LPS-assembly protein LptD [Lewinellaceae bacterium]
MKAKTKITFFLIALAAHLWAQDTIPDVSALLQPDTSVVFADTLPPAPQIISVPISKNAPESVIEYGARDSMVWDVENQKIFLYGASNVKYTTISLTAGYTEFDWSENIVRASGVEDSTGHMQEKPNFSDGSNKFEARDMRYNYLTHKGTIIQASTMQNNMYVIGEKAKFFSAAGDTTKSDIIYNKNAIFTTCDHEQPHFGVRSNKQKVIPNKLAVVGPSNLEIMGVPTPLWLPFGFFPLKTGKSTGLLFPRNYETSSNWGFGLRGVGWYFPISDFFNLQITGDIYLKGSYRVRAIGNYAKRYKYRGNFTLEYGNLRTEDSRATPFRTETFSLQLSHNQDSKAHPSRSIGGTINLQTNNAQSYNYNDPSAVLNTTLRSNFTYSERFPGKPFNLSAGFQHSQNTKTRQMTINFPTFNFQTQTLYPFKRKGAPSQQRWYEKIAITYRGEAKAELQTYDTTLFKAETLKDIQYGARHKVTTNTSMKFFKYFNFNPSANYDEVWFLETSQKTFDPTLIIHYDTIVVADENPQIIPTDTVFGMVLDSTVFGFKPLRKFNTGFNIDTKLFGTLLFRNGPLRGIRHTMTPRVGFNFTPDYTNPRWGYFRKVQQDTREPDNYLDYTIFSEGLYSGDRPSNTGQQMALTYGLSNILEAKTYSRRDSTTKNVRLIRSLNINGSYNFAADTLRFSPISLNANTSLLKDVVSVLFNASWDPYEVDAKGRRIDKFVWDTRKVPLRFVDARVSLSTSLTVKTIRGWFDRKENGVESQAPKPVLPQASNGFWDLFDRFSIRYNMVLQGRGMVEKDTFFIATNTITFNGSVPVTPNWKVQVGSMGYDFVRKSLTYPSISIARDLHCWEMGFSWQPTRSTYAFYLRVDPGSVFDFINIPYQKGSQDTIFSGGFSGF